MSGLLGIHEQALLFHEKRAELLASNLANAETPHYQAKDMAFKRAMNNAQTSLSSTQADHINPQQQDPAFETLYRVPMQTSLDGNTVETEIEQAKYAENAMQYMASLNFITSRAHNILAVLKGD